MKKLFTLLSITLLFATASNATVTSLEMDSTAYQVVVDYVDTNISSDYVNSYGTADYYYGASAYYENFDAVYDGSFDTTTFSSWEAAVKTAILDAVLPSYYTSPAENDSFCVSFKYYNGSTKVDSFVFVYSSSAFTAVNDRSDIYAFILDEQVDDATIDADAKTVEITVASGTDITSLTPLISYSCGAAISPVSGASIDFTNAVTYTVTSEKSVSTNWTVTVSEMEDTPTAIYDIQYVSDPATDDASPLLDNTVNVKGVVTAFFSSSSYNGYFVQDGDGEWDGIYVYDNTTSTTLEQGDSVKVAGSIAEYYNLTELVASSVEVIASRGTVPSPVAVSAALTESLEGVLVTISGATLAADESSDSKAYLTATVGGVEYKIYDQIYGDVSYESGKTYNITGPVTYTYSYYRICPRSASDVTEASAINTIEVNSFDIYPNPASSVLNIVGASSETIIVRNIAGQQVAVKTIADNQINVSELSTGIYFIQAGNQITRFVKK